LNEKKLEQNLNENAKNKENGGKTEQKCVALNIAD
jgi:hypothetical protein